MTWPPGLQSLTFGENFDQGLENVTWPASLQSVTFGENFNQSLVNVRWPAGIQNLAFDIFSADKLNVVWPEGLQSLVFLSNELFEFPEEVSPALEDSDDSDSRVDSGVVLRALPRRAGWPRALHKLVFDDLALAC